MKVLKHGNLYKSNKNWWSIYKIGNVFCPECGVINELRQPSFPYNCECHNCGCKFECYEEDIAGVK